MDDMSGIMKSIIKSAEAANKPEEGDYFTEVEITETKE